MGTRADKSRPLDAFGDGGGGRHVNQMSRPDAPSHGARAMLRVMKINKSGPAHRAGMSSAELGNHNLGPQFAGANRGY